MLRNENPTGRYKLFTMFMTEIYSGLCDAEAAQKIKDYLEAQAPTATLAHF